MPIPPPPPLSVVGSKAGWRGCFSTGMLVNCFWVVAVGSSLSSVSGGGWVRSMAFSAEEPLWWS